MLVTTPNARTRTVVVRTHEAVDLPRALPRLIGYATCGRQASLSQHPGWLEVLQRGLGHGAFCLEAVEHGRTCGMVLLSYVRSLLFGRFLVGLPYLNTGGIVADDPYIRDRLIERAVSLADDLRVRYLELRHEAPLEHASLTGRLSAKVHMRLRLPADVDGLWKHLSSKVRNQVRKGQKSGLEVAWGGEELLGEFYTVFSHNMRDLGTPVYPRKFFQEVLRDFPDRAELAVIRSGPTPAAAALLLHGWGISEVPSAGCLRQFNPVCANMLLYYHLLERAVERQQDVFDFGRSTIDGNTYRFKKQWGAEPEQAEWQYYLREGHIADMRPENPRYQRAIRLWQRLPVSVTCLLGPHIVRGIP